MHTGPAMTRVRSSTLTPANGRAGRVDVHGGSAPPPGVASRRTGGSSAVASRAASARHDAASCIAAAAPAAVDDGRSSSAALRPATTAATAPRSVAGSSRSPSAASAARAVAGVVRVQADPAVGRPVVAGDRVPRGRPLPAERRERSSPTNAAAGGAGVDVRHGLVEPSTSPATRRGDRRSGHTDGGGRQAGDVEDRGQHVALAGHGPAGRATSPQPTASQSLPARSAIDVSVRHAASAGHRRPPTINVDRSTLTGQRRSDPEVEEVVVAKRLERAGVPAVARPRGRRTAGTRSAARRGSAAARASMA